MYIACPSCETRYQVPDSVMNAEGRTVKCAVCQHSWLARAEDPDAPSLDERQAVSAPDRDDFAFNEEDMGSNAGDAVDNDGAFEDRPDDIATWGNDFEDTPDSFENLETFEKNDMENPEDEVFSAAPGSRRIVVKRKRKNPHAMMAFSGAVAVMLIASLVWFREDVVRIYPQSNTVYAGLGLKVNLRGLEFENVEIEHVAEGGLEVLKIKGEIINVRNYAVVLPTLRFALNDMGRAEVFSWTKALQDPFVRPGARLSFETQLIAPPPEGETIEVRFIDRDATIAGLEG